jgi:anti-sigma-K factor RskA
MNAGGCPPDADTALTWVLGTLGADEAERFRQHLETCPICRADVARFQHVADALADAPAASSPPPAIRDRLLALAEEEAAMSRALDHVDAQPARPAKRRRSITLVGAVLAVAGVMTGLVLRSEDKGDPSTPPRTLVGTVSDDAGGARARATVVMRGGSAELVLTDLAGPPRGRVYQAWIVRPPAAPLPTGALFSIPREGDTRVRLPDLRGAERVIVTAEPPRGSQIPSPPPRVTVLTPR